MQGLQRSKRADSGDTCSCAGGTKSATRVARTSVAPFDTTGCRVHSPGRGTLASQLSRRTEIPTHQVPGPIASRSAAANGVDYLLRAKLCASPALRVSGNSHDGQLARELLHSAQQRSVAFHASWTLEVAPPARQTQLLLSARSCEASSRRTLPGTSRQQARGQIGRSPQEHQGESARVEVAVELRAVRVPGRERRKPDAVLLGLVSPGCLPGRLQLLHKA